MGEEIFMATGFVKKKTRVYFGPDKTLYPSENSYAGPNDAVVIFWREGDWYYIEYPTSASPKRMYIPKSAVSNINGKITNYDIQKQTRYVNLSGPTYWGPESIYPFAGSVALGEKVQYLFPQRENDYVLIEYMVDNHQKKRAWIHGNNLAMAPIQDGEIIYKIIKDPLNKNENYTGANHVDYAVNMGTPVYAMCDGIFTFGYYWGKVKENSPNSYISLGRGYRLIPDNGWQTVSGFRAKYIEYGHLSELAGYQTPDYVERCNNGNGCSYNACYEKHIVKLAEKHVKCGEFIGYSGNSGNTLGKTGNHLHIKLV